MKKKITEAIKGMTIGTMMGVLLGLLFPRQAVALYRAEHRLIRSIVEWIKAVITRSHTDTHIETHKISEDEVPQDIRDALTKMVAECPNVIKVEDL